MDAISEQNLSRLAKSLGDSHREIRSAAATARANAFVGGVPGVWDNTLVLPVQKPSFAAGKNWRVAAVDGGVMSRELHGSALAVVKTCAVEFTYLADGSLDTKSGNGVRYFPNKQPELFVSSEHSLDSTEFHWFVNLARARLEIKTALAAAEKFQPDLLLLDGSIVPQGADKPRDDSILADAYLELVETFKQLYESCAQNKTLLAGVSKDSRGKQFLSYLPQVVPAVQPFRHRLERLGDSVFLSELLKTGERSFAFSYSTGSAGGEGAHSISGGVSRAKAGMSPVMRDLGPWAKGIVSYYVRPVPFDRPSRVDVLCPELIGHKVGLARAKIDASASWLYRLCAINPNYGYPAVLIEADLRAAMRPAEFDRVFSQLKRQTGSSNPFFFELRRNSRPFR